MVSYVRSRTLAYSLTVSKFHFKAPPSGVGCQKFNSIFSPSSLIWPPMTIRSFLQVWNTITKPFIELAITGNFPNIFQIWYPCYISWLHFASAWLHKTWLFIITTEYVVGSLILSSNYTMLHVECTLMLKGTIWDNHNLKINFLNIIVHIYIFSYSSLV